MLNSSSGDHKPFPEELFERFAKKICKPNSALEETLDSLKLSVGLAFYQGMPQSQPELFKELCIRCQLFQLRVRDSEQFLKHFLSFNDLEAVTEKARKVHLKRAGYGC